MLDTGQKYSKEERAKKPPHPSFELKKRFDVAIPWIRIGTNVTDLRAAAEGKESGRHCGVFVSGTTTFMPANLERVCAEHADASVFVDVGVS